MITRLEVDGFKSLRNFAVDLEPFTVLVGPNDAGKSNILEALALAAAAEQTTPEEALKRGRGSSLDKFSRHGATTGTKIAIALECLEWDDGELYRLRNELTISRTPHRAWAERVELEARTFEISAVDDRWLDGHPEWSGDIRSLPPEDQGETWSPLFRLVQLHAAYLRDPSDRLDSRTLAPDASNLPSVLATLSEIQLGKIRAAMAALIPSIVDFDIKPNDDNLQIEFKTREGETVPARLASDGTLRALGLLTAVIARPTDGDTIICIEEPENGIYPGRLTRLIDILRDATDSTPWREGDVRTPPPQIILTTHSPVALEALRQHHTSVRFIDTIWRDGVRSTRARRIVDDSSLTDRMTEASTREIELRLRTTPLDEDR